MENNQDEMAGVEGGPMAMGMAMAQKMTAQMSQGDDKPPMEKMIGMCSEMLNAIRQTNALAVFATPELQHAFADWLKEIEGKAEALLANSEKDAAVLAVALKISEESVTYILARLAMRGPSRGRHEPELAKRRGSPVMLRHR